MLCARLFVLVNAQRACIMFDYNSIAEYLNVKLHFVVLGTKLLHCIVIMTDIESEI